MIVDVLCYGDKRLRQRCADVTAFDELLLQEARDLVDTMFSHNGEGLAAPQVGVLKRIFVTRNYTMNNEGNWQRDGTHTVFVNPRIVDVSHEMDLLEEGCLSLPKIRVDVIRPISARIEAMDLAGKPFSRELTGFPTRAFMHENDHLNGVLIIDRSNPKDKKRLKAILKEL